MCCKLVKLQTWYSNRKVSVWPARFPNCHCKLVGEPDQCLTCQPEGSWKSQPWERPSGQITPASLLREQNIRFRSNLVRFPAPKLLKASWGTWLDHTLFCQRLWTWCSQRSGCALEWPSSLATWSECRRCNGGGSCWGLWRDATLLENSPRCQWLHIFLEGHGSSEDSDGNVTK